MRAMYLAIVLALAVLATPAAVGARGWQGVTPGATAQADVIARFGQPSTQGKLSGRNAIVYKGEQAIAGTRQAQFFSGDDGKVVEIVVFPAAQLDRESVEGTYGAPTQKAFTEEFRAVWRYRPAGITVYFGKDGGVEAISFKSGEGPRGDAAPPAGGAGPDAPPSPSR